MEIWKPVCVSGVTYSIYEVSNLGRIRNIVSSRIVQGGVSRGYRHVGLYYGNGQRKTLQVHRIVALAFLGEKQFSEHQIDHIDGNKLNNTVDNLRYVTPSENIKNTFALGRIGYKKPEKLTKTDVATIRKRLTNGEMQKLIANDYQISQSMVTKIKKGQAWAK